MARISVVLTFVCACASLRAALTPPPYVESLRSLEKFENHITQHLLSMKSEMPPETDYRRQYVVIIAQIGEFAKWLADTCVVDYEQEYMRQLKMSVPLGFEKPQYIVDQVEHYLAKAKNQSLNTISLVKSDCGAPDAPTTCDVAIDHVVNGDLITYKDDAETLLLLGEMALQYLNHADEMVSSAQNFSAVSYLVDNMNSLRQLIFAADQVLKKLHNKIC